MAEEAEHLRVITHLSNRAIEDYEDLQRRHQTTSTQCKRLEEERDEAVKRLQEFHQVSQMVLAEVQSIQDHLHVERTCRESAEALASQLNRQNRSLKRKSMMLLSHLSPETVREMNLHDDEDEEDKEDEEDEELQAADTTCHSAKCQSTITELRNELEKALKDKTQAKEDVEAVREQLRETTEQLLKEKHDSGVFRSETQQQKKLLGKFSRVSQFAVEEYQVLQDTLDLERDLRAEAERFARQMMVEQKQLKRQSQLLLQSSSPTQALQDALSQVSKLTQDLETQRLDHLHQVKQMEEGLKRCDAQREAETLRRTLELLEEDRNEWSNRCSKAQTEVKDLRRTVEELQKRLQAATNPPPAPPPPPPPPAPPPPVPSPVSNPLSALLSLIRKRRDVSTDIALVLHDSATPPEVDVRQQAVEEMMQRIKKGVQLRPVGQAPNQGRRRMERLPSSSAIQELQGILENFNRTSHQPKTAPPSADGDQELLKILLRRRDALETQPKA